MKDRLLKFINDQQITSSKLAEQTGVQRSSISHVLSGRNKPGFDFIHNLLEQYPDLNAEWLILGKGAMYKKHKNQTENKANVPKQGLFTNENAEKENPDIKTESENNESGYKLTTDKINKITNHTEAVEKIVVFYQDNTFKEYRPKGKV